MVAAAAAADAAAASLLLFLFPKAWRRVLPLGSLELFFVHCKESSS